MDKKEANFEDLYSSGQKGGSIFQTFLHGNITFFIFDLSSKTDIGSAGEQPVRDCLDG